MSHGTTLPDVRDLAGGGDREHIDSSVARCLEATIDALRRTNVANDRELLAAARMVEDKTREGHPLDIIDAVARIQGTDETHMGPAIARLSTAVASTMLPAPPLMPFASKLITPSSFYESFQQILALARALLAPVLFAEDTDAIGTGSANPIAARILAGEIHTSVERRFGIKPFLTVVRLDYESWTFLTRKHFSR